MNHSQKLRKARKMLSKIERKKNLKIQQPRGVMLSRVFNSKAWNDQRLHKSTREHNRQFPDNQAKVLPAEAVK